MARIKKQDVEKRLKSLQGWALRGGALRRQLTFDSFADALAFVVRLGLAAEAADHHPDITISYRRVTLIYVTHSAGGLTSKDFRGARTASALADAMGVST
jgi:4a-hydroxytetrahydrobiopterin dehydratase